MNEIHEETKIKLSDAPDIDKYPKSWVKIYFKQFPRFKKIKLPKPQKMNGKLLDILKKRTSVREFNKKSINLNKLSSLLFYSAGILKGKTIDQTRRPYPSAGARFPIEIYLSITNCKGVDDGVYHYDVLNHFLELIIKGDERKKIMKFVKQNMVLNSNITFFLTGVFRRTQVKYGIRGYRYVLLDAGHLGQNFYLVSTALKLGCCTIGGFSDDEANKYLDLTEGESIIYMGVIG